MTEICWKTVIVRLDAFCDETGMKIRLMMHLAEGIAHSVQGYRSGARHAMMIFVFCEDHDHSGQLAIDFALKKGWDFIELRKSKELDPDCDLIEDDVLRRAAVDAKANGSSVVVYRDELRSDS